MTPTPPPDAATTAISALRDHGATVATAESVTGGLLAGALTAVPGSSAVVLGGVVAYSIAIKKELLGVPADVLETHGPVHPDTAMWMALGAARRFQTSIAVATTGVAGPEPHGGMAPGYVLFGWWARGNGGVAQVQLSGDRGEVRSRSVEVGLNIIGQCARDGRPLIRDGIRLGSAQSVEHGVDQAHFRFPMS